jgi:hypothetical protein
MVTVTCCSGPGPRDGIGIGLSRHEPARRLAEKSLQIIFPMTVEQRLFKLCQ